MKYNLSVGIEAHFELLTNSKLFCGCATSFGAVPNTNCCPTCLGMPGALPVMNKKALILALKAGIATHCSIGKSSYMDRKNYFYPDLSKQYQITQYYNPVCRDGYVKISEEKNIRIDRIHLEEDAGKLVYKDKDIFIDYNRNGIPLIEIVSKPDMNSVEEVKLYIEKLIDLIRYLEISDCKMYEGSMRCDVNVSVSRADTLQKGTKVELKNLNSVKFILKALEFEQKRQVNILEEGGKIKSETRRFNELTGRTESMRDKENNFDYRYFKDPDLVVFDLTACNIDDIIESMPEDFDFRLRRYITEYALPEADARILLKTKKVADYFDKASDEILNKKLVSNLLLGKIFSKIKTQAQKDEFNIPISSEDLRDLCRMLETGEIDHKLAAYFIDKMFDTKMTLSEVLSENRVEYIKDNELKSICDLVIKNNDAAVKDLLNGKSRALQFLVGQVIKNTSGNVQVKKVSDILGKQLNLYSK